MTRLKLFCRQVTEPSRFSPRFVPRGVYSCVEAIQAAFCRIARGVHPSMSTHTHTRFELKSVSERRWPGRCSRSPGPCPTPS